jgi:hypothetical protein
MVNHQRLNFARHSVATLGLFQQNACQRTDSSARDTILQHRIEERAQ